MWMGECSKSGFAQGLAMRHFFPMRIILHIRIFRTYAEIRAYVRESIVLAHLGATAWLLHTYCGALWQYVLLAELKKSNYSFVNQIHFLLQKIYLFIFFCYYIVIIVVLFHSDKIMVRLGSLQYLLVRAGM